MAVRGAGAHLLALEAYGGGEPLNEAQGGFVIAFRYFYLPRRPFVDQLEGAVSCSYK